MIENIQYTAILFALAAFVVIMSSIEKDLETWVMRIILAAFWCCGAAGFILTLIRIWS